MTDRLLADTNLFLRYLTNDVPAQAEAVEQLLRQAASGEVSLVVTDMVIAEIVWTLESFYRLPKQDIRDRVLAIANTPGIELQDRDLIVQAALWYAEKNVDFTDAYNATWALAKGLHTVCTFNRRHFVRFDDLEVLVPSSGAPGEPRSGGADQGLSHQP